MAVLQCGDRVGAVRVARLIGRGTYGEIYEAAGPDGPVALKVMRPDRQTSQMRSRFQNEVEALETIPPHPNVVRILAPPEVLPDGTRYFLMEYAEGGSLREWFRRGGYGAGEFLRIGTGLAAGLAAIHRAGILHRDLALENILLDSEGTPKISDFGLCHQENGATGPTPEFWFAHGDPEFTAPERIFHLESGEVGDAYSLGAILYLLGTRRSLYLLGELSFLYATYVRQLEQFFRTCMAHQLPSPRVDLRPVYQYYVERAATASRDEPPLVFPLGNGKAPRERLLCLLDDLLHPDYLLRLRKFGSLGNVEQECRAIADLLEREKGTAP